MFLSALYNVYSIQARYQSFLYFFCLYVLSLNVFVPYCGSLGRTVRTQPLFYYIAGLYLSYYSSSGLLN